MPREGLVVPPKGPKETSRNPLALADESHVPTPPWDVTMGKLGYHLQIPGKKKLSAEYDNLGDISSRYR